MWEAERARAGSKDGDLSFILGRGRMRQCVYGQEGWLCLVKARNAAPYYGQEVLGVVAKSTGVVGTCISTLKCAISFIAAGFLCAQVWSQSGR